MLCKTDDPEGKKQVLNLEETKQKALTGDVDAAYLVGRSYFYGENGIEENYQEGYHWFDFGSKLPHGSINMYGLAICYHKGRGVEKDLGKATRLFSKAYEHIRKHACDDLDCQFILGEYYQYGYGNVEQDDDEALFWYKKAAEEGFPTAQYCLGMCYKNKKYRDPNSAFYWFEQGAKNGHRHAICQLGLCYYYGKGTPVDFKQAIHYLQMADTREAHYYLGKCYELGLGVDADTTKAIEQYEYCIEKGFLDAVTPLLDLYPKDSEDYHRIEKLQQ